MVPAVRHTEGRAELEDEINEPEGATITIKNLNSKGPARIAEMTSRGEGGVYLPPKSSPSSKSTLSVRLP